MQLIVHLASGIGNIVLSTPLLLVLARYGCVVDVLLDGDYPETGDLLRGWSGIRTLLDRRAAENWDNGYDFIIPAIPPFYWEAYRRRYVHSRRCIARPVDELFYRDEQGYYLEFARTLGFPVQPAPHYFLPVAPSKSHEVDHHSLVLAPGCKTGSMAAKRWPFFPELAECFEDVVVTGTADDLYQSDGRKMSFPHHVRSLVGEISLRETAQVLAAAGVVIANDSGLGHVAGAVGAPTILLFGPTPDRTLGTLPPNVRVLRTGLPCEPCWFTAPLKACSKSITCLHQLKVSQVAAEVRNVLTVK
jgi:ADP-heptose:LPS heptosyltransferase